MMKLHLMCAILCAWASVDVFAQDKQDGQSVPRVSEADLPKRAKNETVQIVLRLWSLNAEEAAPELKKMLSANGELIPLTVGNQLLISDLAGNLSDIVKVIREVDDIDEGKRQCFSYTCKSIQAGTAKKILDDLFGVGRNRLQRVFIAVDEGSNTILINGPGKLQAEAKEVLSKIDATADRKSPGKGEPAIEKPAERRYPFAMDGKPWPQVLQWLSEISGRPVIQKSTPEGKLTFISPKGKTYTLGEIVDLLNESLLTRKYHLMQSEKAYHLVAADEWGEQAFIPRVTLDELPKRGRYEMVGIVVVLKYVSPDDLAPQIKKVLGSSGGVAAVGNQLVTWDLAGNLREVLKLVKKLDVPAKKDAPSALTEASARVLRTTTVFKLKHAIAGDLVKTLMQVYRDEKSLAMAADTRSNSIVVRAPAALTTELEAVIVRLDQKD